MKKIMIIGRPYSNGGDYLIFDRMGKAVQKAYPEAVLTWNLKNDDQFDVEELNQYDAVITGGGGAQFSEAHIKTSFLYQHFEELTVPIHYMGTGLYGADGSDETIYDYRYSDDIVKYFRKVIERGGQVASRDWTVDTILRNNGIEDVIMAGCPAWYDLELLDNDGLSVHKKRHFIREQVRKIAVSNHGLTKNSKDHAVKQEQIENLILFLQKIFPDAKMQLTFNDGYMTKYSRDYNLALQEWAQTNGVTCIDLSNDAGKFAALDETDLHIGFRVHTHLYCTSKKIPSLLIEEDIRGYGMNETLHLPHITAYRQGCTPEDFEPNPYLNTQIALLLKQAGQGRLDFEAVYREIEHCFRTGMQTWLENLLR